MRELRKKAAGGLDVEVKRRCPVCGLSIRATMRRYLQHELRCRERSGWAFPSKQIRA